MTYETAITAAGAALVRRLMALLASGLGDDDVVLVAADVIAAANVQAAHVGTLAFAGAMHDATGTLTMPSPPSLVHHVDPVRLRAAVDTVMQGETAQRAARLQVLAQSETSEAGAWAMGEALRADTRVIGWTRVLDGKACQLCRWWWRDGRVWPKNHRMPRHKGCRCGQSPVTREQHPMTPDPVSVREARQPAIPRRIR